MAKNQKHKHCTPEQLYLKILEIGSECISCGTNLKKIKSELSNCGLISTDEDGTTLKIIFQNSFAHDETNKHHGNYCKKPEPEFECNPKDRETYERLLKESENFPHEYECTWFLTPEALMNLLRLREAEKNRKTTRRTLWISLASLGTALLILISNASKPKFTEVFGTTEYKHLKSELSTTLSNIDSSLVLIYQQANDHQVDDSLRNSNFLEKTNLEKINEISLSLKNINYELYKLNKNYEQKQTN